MKILYVYGDDDYHALSYEGSGLTQAEVVRACEENGGSHEFEGDDYQFYADVITFGEVDPKFINWVKQFQDYDDSKHRNFYVVEE